MNGQVINELMRERGFSRADLVAKAGISESTLRRILAEEDRSTNFSTAELIADALDVPLVKILSTRHLMSPSERAKAENIPIEMPIAVADPEVVINDGAVAEKGFTADVKIAVMHQMLIERSLMLNDANEKVNDANNKLVEIIGRLESTNAKASLKERVLFALCGALISAVIFGVFA